MNLTRKKDTVNFSVCLLTLHEDDIQLIISIPREIRIWILHNHCTGWISWPREPPVTVMFLWRWTVYKVSWAGQPSSRHELALGWTTRSPAVPFEDGLTDLKARLHFKKESLPYSKFFRFHFLTQDDPVSLLPFKNLHGDHRQNSHSCSVQSYMLVMWYNFSLALTIKSGPSKIFQ